MPLSIEVSGFAINVSSASEVSGLTVSGISTANSNDIVYVWVGQTYSGTVAISGGGLTWTQRIPIFGQGGILGRSFYGIAASTLSNANITVGSFSNSGSKNYAYLAVVSVAGANTSSPFDGNASIPLTLSGTGSVQGAAQSGVVSTTNANDILLAFMATAAYSGWGYHASGWTQLSQTSGQTTGGSAATEYLIVSSAQTSAPVSFVSGSTAAGSLWILAGDAIQAASAAAPSFFQHSGPLRLKRFNR